MKKLLFLIVAGIGLSALFKGNHVTVTPDGQVRVAGWTVPLPDSVRSSPLMGMASILLQGNLQASMGGAPTAPGAPAQSGTSALAGAPMLGALTQPGAFAHPGALAAQTGAPGQARAVAPPPALPIVTSAVSTYNPNPPSNANAGSARQPTSAEQFNAVAKALRGQ